MPNKEGKKECVCICHLGGHPFSRAENEGRAGHIRARCFCHTPEKEMKEGSIFIESFGFKDLDKKIDKIAEKVMAMRERKKVRQYLKGVFGNFLKSCEREVMEGQTPEDHKIIQEGMVQLYSVPRKEVIKNLGFRATPPPTGEKESWEKEKEEAIAEAEKRGYERGRKEWEDIKVKMITKEGHDLINEAIAEYKKKLRERVERMWDDPEIREIRGIKYADGYEKARKIVLNFLDEK